MAELSLDVPEIQVLVNYPADADGMYWHHRILLHRVGGGDWITLTPDHEFQRHDLSTQAHRVLERHAPFPSDISDEVYAHDPIARGVLQAFKRQSQIMAAVLGEGAVDELDTVAWVIADAAHKDFGAVVDANLMNTPATCLTFASRGVVVREGEEIFVERINLKDLESWKNEKGKELGDVRLLAGKRRLDLSAAVALMHEGKDPEFPVTGVRAAREFHDSVAYGPGNFLSYHSEWMRLSGVSNRNAAAHVHRNLCEVLRLMRSYDQIDCSSLAAGETLCRWLIQTEMAVERSPGQPDYQGLDIVAGTATMPDGRASTSKFQEWVSSRLKERAAIWKQDRLYRQERRQGPGRGARGGDAADDAEDEDDAPSRRRRKKKNKSGKEKKTDGRGGAGGDAAGASK